MNHLNHSLWTWLLGNLGWRCWVARWRWRREQSSLRNCSKEEAEYWRTNHIFIYDQVWEGKSAWYESSSNLKERTTHDLTHARWMRSLQTCRERTSWTQDTFHHKKVPPRWNLRRLEALWTYLLKINRSIMQSWQFFEIYKWNIDNVV